MSAAGRGEGLACSRSSAFFDTVRILRSLQQLPASPSAYLLENTYMLWGHSADRVTYVDYPYITSVLGTGFTCDAARFSSGAYRLRMFWTNLQHPAHLRLVLRQWQRPAGLLVNRLLDPARVPLLQIDAPPAAAAQLPVQRGPHSGGGVAHPGVLPQV